MPIGVDAVNVTNDFAPARRLDGSKDALRIRRPVFVTRIIDLTATNPEYGVRSVACHDVAPMLFQLGDAHLRQMLEPSAHDCRHDPGVDQMLDTSVGEFEKLW